MQLFQAAFCIHSAATRLAESRCHQRRQGTVFAILTKIQEVNKTSNHSDVRF